MTVIISPQYAVISRRGKPERQSKRVPLEKISALSAVTFHFVTQFKSKELFSSAAMTAGGKRQPNEMRQDWLHHPSLTTVA